MPDIYNGIHKDFVKRYYPTAYCVKDTESDYWNIIGYVNGDLTVLSGTAESDEAAWAWAADRIEDRKDDGRTFNYSESSYIHQRRA